MIDFECEEAEWTWTSTNPETSPCHNLSLFSFSSFARLYLQQPLQAPYR